MEDVTTLKQPPFLAIGIFCEELRKETSGATSIIGIFPENVRSDRFPATIPKLTSYVRVVLPLPLAVSALTAEVHLPGIKAPVAKSEFTRDDLAKFVEEHRQHGDASLITILIEMNAFNVPLLKPGRGWIEVSVDEHRALCGVMNVHGMEGVVAPR